MLAAEIFDYLLNEPILSNSAELGILMADYATNSMVSTTILISTVFLTTIPTDDDDDDYDVIRKANSFNHISKLHAISIFVVVKKKIISYSH